jgi:hypothetical protein
MITLLKLDVKPFVEVVEAFMDRTTGTGGSKLWFVADGWLPLQSRTESTGFEGHEAIMILNCADQDAHVLMDVFFENREPTVDTSLTVPARQPNLAYIGMMAHAG